MIRIHSVEAVFAQSSATVIYESFIFDEFKPNGSFLKVSLKTPMVPNKANRIGATCAVIKTFLHPLKSIK